MDKRSSINGSDKPDHVPSIKRYAKTIKSATFINNCTPNYNNTLIIMLLLSAFLIFFSLSVAAIPLGPRSPSIPGLPVAGLPALDGLPGLDGLPVPPVPATGLLKAITLKRFIMDADYATGSGPPVFLGKSPHKRRDPLSSRFGSAATLR